MAKMKVQELESVLLDQIEKLNDDSVLEDAEKMLIERSNAMVGLTNSFIGVNRMKLDVVKELNKGGNLYESYLGIESVKPTGKA